MTVLESAKLIGPVSGIYCFINKYSGKCYVGQSENILRRIKSHVSSITGTPKTSFQRNATSLGIESFDLELIEQCKESLMTERERFWILFYDSAFNGFNTICDPSDSQYPNAVTRSRMSRASKARCKDPKVLEAMRKRAVDYFSEQSNRDAASVAHKIRWVNPSERARASIQTMRYFSNPENRKKHSVGQKAALSNPITREKMRVSAIRKFSNPEARKAVAISNAIGRASKKLKGLRLELMRLNL